MLKFIHGVWSKNGGHSIQDRFIIDNNKYRKFIDANVHD